MLVILVVLDNYFTEAYPQMFYNRMKPVFQSFNIPLVVRNHAIGNNPCYPYDACIATHMGTDLDILTWEQSMNCGRDWKPLNTFTRSAAVMPKQPTVMYFLSGGPTWTAKECAAKNLTAGNEAQIAARSALTAEEEQLLRTTYQDIATKKVNTLDTMEFLSNRGAGFNVHERYFRFAPMGHSTNSIGDYKCYGPYNYTFSEKTPGGGAAWHPGRVGHQLRGDSLAYALLSILSDSVDTVASLTSLDGSIANACKSSSTSSASAAAISASSLPPPVVIGKPMIDPMPVGASAVRKHRGKRGLSSDRTNMRSLLISKEEIVNELLSYRLPPTSLLSYLAASPEAPAKGPSKLSIEERSIYHKLADRIHSIIHSLPNANVLNDAISIRVKVLYLYCETLFENLLNNPLPDSPATVYPETELIPQCYTDYLPKSASNNLYDILLHRPNITLKPEDWEAPQDGSDDMTPEEWERLYGNSSGKATGNTRRRFLKRRNHNSRRGLKLAKDFEDEYPMPILVNSTTNRTITTPLSLEGIEWKKELSFFDVNGVSKGEEHHFGYLDRKYIYLSTGVGTSLYLFVSVKRDQKPIWLCECQKGFGKYPTTMSDLLPGAKVIMHYFARPVNPTSASSSKTAIQSGLGNKYEKHSASFITVDRRETGSYYIFY
jgi:hypothetical protein